MDASWVIYHCQILITHTIHVWYIYLHENHKDQPKNVGKYTSPMDASWVIYHCQILITHTIHGTDIFTYMKTI